jgi:hypothetical protein
MVRTIIQGAVAMRGVVITCGSHPKICHLRRLRPVIRGSLITRSSKGVGQREQPLLLGWTQEVHYPLRGLSLSVVACGDVRCLGSDSGCFR